jgi:beta-xylosidase
MDRPGAPVIDHGCALHVDDVPWAQRQMWAPDAARLGSRYHLYFPAKDAQGVFRIGVATSSSPVGPFRAEPRPIEGSYSIDPAVFVDDDGSAYLYFGGIWGGQLQCWESGHFDARATEPGSGVALQPRVARLTPDYLQLEQPPQRVVLCDERGEPLAALDKHRRYFEGPWMHKHGGLYYFSYSTGDTHHLCYATGTSPTGPFVYRGRLLAPVVGWTTHHSTVCFEGQWYLFYHDSTLSGGDTARRSVKMQPFDHEPDGSIRTLEP